MADTKITALQALTAADPANDVLPIVDVNDFSMAGSGTTKQISINNILGCSGTATLASATITGNLTVSTAAQFNGGALAGYLNGSLMFGSSGNTLNLFAQSSGISLVNNTGSASLLFANNSGVFTFGDGAGGTRMTLNATGLLVGTTNDLTGANISSSKGLGTANIATNRFATVEYGSGAGGAFTTITVSFTVPNTVTSVIIEALLSGFSGVYLDHVAGRYSSQTPVVIRNNASAGTTVAALAVDGTGLIYTLTITTVVQNPVIKVKATAGGLSGSITLPVITFA